AVPGLQYTWTDEIITWPHGDTTPKAFTMSFPDNDVYQPPRNLTLTFLGQDSVTRISTALVINDDGDAGMLGFSSQRNETLEGSAGSGCLLYARREGGSRPTEVRVALLGGSWVVISRVINPLIGVLTELPCF
ncbi:unnamed protein product, partial [Symbiodinium sp. KB8]